MKILHFFRKWVRELIIHKNLGAQVLLNPHLRRDDEYFFKYYRMNVEDFDELLLQIKPLVEKKFTHWRKPISPDTRLAITLR